MTKRYAIHFVTTAQYTVEVEADSPEEAIELANNQADFPFFPGGMSGDLGDWGLASDLFPNNKPEDDYSIIDDDEGSESL